MEAKDVRELSQKELEAKNLDLQQEIFNLKFQFHTGQLTNFEKLKSLKKDLARIKTILREKELNKGGAS